MAHTSILLPTYEPKPQHLCAAIESAVQQSCTDWQMLIHDDASHADVKAIVEPYLADPRIRFVQSEKRRGIGGNCNAALAYAEGEYVQFLFQDDEWEKDYLQSAVAVLESNLSVGFVGVHHRYVCENTVGEARTAAYEALNAFKKAHIQAGLHRRAEFLRWWIAQGLKPNVIGEPSFVLLRRSLLAKAGPFLEDMPQNLDTEYWLRCLMHADWYYIDTMLGSFRVHAAGASMQNDEAGLGLFDRLRMFDRLLSSLPSSDTRTLVRQSLQTQIGLMARKFFARRQSGGKVQASGSGALMRILLRHPLLIITGILGQRFKRQDARDK